LSGMILLRLDWIVPQKTECSCGHTYAEKLRFTKHLRNPREGMADGFTSSAPFAVVQCCKLEASFLICIIALEQTRSGAITEVGGSVSGGRGLGPSSGRENASGAHGRSERQLPRHRVSTDEPEVQARSSARTGITWGNEYSGRGSDCSAALLCSSRGISRPSSLSSGWSRHH
jgi:hypothetical protein